MMLPILATVATVATADARTFAVLLANMGRVQDALTALNKRAARKGLPLLVWTWGKAYTDPKGNARVPLALPTEIPRFAGWAFLAALQHLDGENIVRAVTGATVPEMYRNRGPQCDHCRTVRRRHDTFVLGHEDGRTVQVGSTCIGDFLGSDRAGDIAARASFLATARALAEDGCEGFGGGTFENDRLLGSYLPHVARMVREDGWVSRTSARERGEEWRATADCAWLALDSGKRLPDPSAEDKALATSAEEWADSLTDEAVNAERGDYLHNLRAVAHTGLVTKRTAGIAASMIVAYQRHVSREAERAARAARPTSDAYVGTVGGKLTNLPVTLDFLTGYETQYGYTTICKFRTAEGAVLVWKASNPPECLSRANVGKPFILSGSIKGHDSYKGQNQTTVTRCKVKPTA